MKEVIFYFLRLGSLGFGGPLAVIGEMQKELVRKRQWISEKEYLTVLPLIKAMPGPVAFQLAVFLGYRRRGFFGGLASGVSLVFPAFILVIVFARFESVFLENSYLLSVMKGFGIGAMALIISAFFNLAQNQSRKKEFWFWIFASVVAVGLLQFSEVWVVLFTLMSTLIFVWVRRLKQSSRLNEAGTLLALVLMSLKAGALVFGTGLAIVPMLESTVVQQFQWMSHEQFLQAIAIGQITPGPVVITVSYIGYKILGLWGALAATIAIFIPAFVHMVTWFPKAIGWMQKQIWIGFVSTCLTGTIVGIIGLVVLKMFLPLAALQMLMVVALLAALTFFRLPSWLCILISGALGFI